MSENVSDPENFPSLFRQLLEKTKHPQLKKIIEKYEISTENHGNRSYNSTYHKAIMAAPLAVKKKIFEELKIQEINKLNKGGANSSKAGGQYEKDVHKIVSPCSFKGQAFNTQEEKELAGSTSKNDLICNYVGKKVGIEVKTKLCIECMQMKIHKNNDGPWEEPKSSKHPQTVVDRYLKELNTRSNLYFGKMPPFPFPTREAYDAWEKEFLDEKEKRGQGRTKDYRWICSKEDFIKTNYREKGVYYIQIKGHGLYHLGEDVYNFGVPEFKPKKTEMRIRCKRYKGKGCIPRALVLSAYPSDLAPSPYSLDNIDSLPPNLIYNSTQQ